MALTTGHDLQDRRVKLVCETYQTTVFLFSLPALFTRVRDEIAETRRETGKRSRGGLTPFSGVRHPSCDAPPRGV
jgi:hypothetical protein